MAIVGISKQPCRLRRLFSMGEDGAVIEKQCEQINAYLVAGDNIIVEKASQPLSGQSEMNFGNKRLTAVTLSRDERELNLTPEQQTRFVRRIMVRQSSFIIRRYCVVEDHT